MLAPARLPHPRYRRRILGAGLIAGGALFSFGVPVYVGRIEDDLEQRVPEELSEAGFTGVVAEFSGQDGTLRCQQPLSDPAQATEVAYDVWGVRAIELDRSCRVNTAETGAVPSSSGSTLAGEQNGVAAAAGTESVGHAYASVVDLVDADPRFSYLSILLAESGVAEHLEGAVTLFAPTDAAFELLPADVNAQLRADRRLLATVLAHHVATGRLLSGELVAGPLTTGDESTVEIRVVGSSVAVDGTPIVDADLVAGTGVVHAIDRLLIPDGIELGESDPSVTATQS
jgi:uncharacterized surface protein with fasciclin (FAS1) repeats